MNSVRFYNCKLRGMADSGDSERGTCLLIDSENAENILKSKNEKREKILTEGLRLH